MAARTRVAGLGALRRQSIRVYNEPYTPNVEERDENEAHILLLQLPEFTQQHVKVKVEAEERTVVVTGDRLVGNNRLLLLDKTYPIPENCVIDQIDHRLENGVLTITMPKQTTESVTAPAVEAAALPPPPPKEPEISPENASPPSKEPEISPENATPPSKEPEQKIPEKGSQGISAGNGIPQPKEPEQPIPEMGSKEISPGNAAPAPKEAEQTIPEKGSEEISPVNEAPSPKEPEQTTPEKGSEEISPVNAAPSETKAEFKGSEEENKGKSAGLQKQASTSAKEEAPTPAPEKGPEQEDSGEAKTTLDRKISSQDQKPTENGKESKTGEVSKNEESAKIATGTPSASAAGVTKFAGGFTVRKLLVPVTASLAAAVGMGVAAYFVYAYHGLSFATV